MNVSVFTLPSGQQLIGNIVEQDESTIVVEYPLIMVFSNPMSLSSTVYTTRYMPMSIDGMVTFNKHNIIGIANIDKPLQQYYSNMVSFYKSNKPKFRTNDSVEEEQREIEQITKQLSNLEDSEDPSSLLETLIESRNKTKH